VTVPEAERVAVEGSEAQHAAMTAARAGAMQEEHQVRSRTQLSAHQLELERARQQLQDRLTFIRRQQELDQRNLDEQQQQRVMAQQVRDQERRRREGVAFMQALAQQTRINNDSASIDGSQIAARHGTDRSRPVAPREQTYPDGYEPDPYEPEPYEDQEDSSYQESDSWWDPGAPYGESQVGYAHGGLTRNYDLAIARGRLKGKY
jgi:hypothetical protein